MNVGMLWFDNDPKSDILTKVNRAATYFSEKYGEQATLCFVHPSMVNGNAKALEAGKKVMAGEIELRTSGTVLPNHFWIGKTDRHMN